MKKFIVIILVLVIIGVPLYFVLGNQRSQDDFYHKLNEFNNLLNEQDYEQAKILYDSASNTLKANYNISLEGYAKTLAEESKEEGSTQDALNLLYDYKNIGYTSTEIDNLVLYYEDLLQSNYIYEKGLEYYLDGDFENAVSCFDDVLEYDENYQNAQDYMKGYKEYILAWNTAKENNVYGRSPMPNSVAYKDNNMYIPYKFTDSNAILKISATTYTVLSFPIVSNDNGAKISNLNIVGDYIFFLLEQKSLSAEDTDMQNTVYRITLTGDDLTKIAVCDYTYLITYKDKFYALSKSKGIVLVNNYFTDEEVLVESDDDIIAMQMTDDGIFYTVDEKDSDINIQYFYNGETSEKVDEETNMHYYDYGDDNIIYYDTNGMYEYMYHENMAAGTANNNQIFAGDIYKYYGLLNDSVIYTFVGDYQQECIRVRDIRNFKTTYKASSSEISYVPLGICYDSGFILLKSDKGISLTTENMRIQQTIQLPHINNAVLLENEEELALEQNYFTEEPIMAKDENRWMYSDEKVNITTEKIYLDYIESTVYVSHIYTDDYKWLKEQTIDKLSTPTDVSDNVVWGIASQSYDNEPSYINKNRGIISEDLYVYNDDGMFIPYRDENVIPSEKVLASNVVYVFSQGDIILENYEVTKDCLLDNGTLSGRSAIGMVEPGHYVAVTAEKSTKSNRGLSLYFLAKIFENEGCISAYSFDYNYLYTIFDNDYLYNMIVKSEDINKFNQIIYYSQD